MGSLTLKTLSVSVRTAARTMLSLWRKNLIASSYLNTASNGGELTPERGELKTASNGGEFAPERGELKTASNGGEFAPERGDCFDAGRRVHTREFTPERGKFPNRPTRF